MVQSMAKGHTLISAAEDLLWPGQRVPAQIAIVHPLSSFVWDEFTVSPLEPLRSAGKAIDPTGLFDSAVDYAIEVYGLYLALAVAMNIPVDFIDEPALEEPAIINQYKVLIVTQPNLPNVSMHGLLSWLRAGGTLITTANAATRDEYNEPTGACVYNRPCAHQ